MLRLGHLALMPSALAQLEPSEIEDWEQPMSHIVSFQRSVNWWLGDAINIGLKNFGDDFWQTLPMDCSFDLMQRCAKVSASYPVRERILELSWTHHQVAQYLPPILRRAVLNMAKDNQWSSQDLKRYIESLDHGTTTTQSSDQEGTSAGLAG